MGDNSIEYSELGNHVMLQRETIDPQKHPMEVFRHYSIPAYDNHKSPELELGSNIGSIKFCINDMSVLLSKLNPSIPRVWMPCTLGKKRSIASTEFLVIKPSSTLYREYLYYALLSPNFRTELQQRVNGTSGSHQRVRPQDVLTIKIPIQEYLLQKAIARVLGSLDDKIELNRQINEKLEAIAQALFKSWFIDFDPVRAKAEGRDTGLPEHISSLFPSSFVDSELGPIPEGWVIGHLGDVSQVIMGQSPPGSTYNEEKIGLPLYQGSTDFGFRYPNRRMYCSEPKRVAQRGSTLISVRAPVGDVNMASEECCIGRGVAEIKGLHSLDSFIYYLVSSLKAQFSIYEAEGTVFGSINKHSLEHLRIIRPASKIMEAFNFYTSCMDTRIGNNEQENQALSEIRDVLLPKLISGELPIPDAERVVGRYL